MTIAPWMYAVIGAVLGYLIRRFTAPKETRTVTMIAPSTPSRAIEEATGGRQREMIGTALAELEAHIRAGNLIDAIKLYREATGQGLKESKDAVEMLMRRLGA
ncbi:MAG: hypothetical protein SFW08_00865 [Gemmatimonadaceae bacterium]|nr:hypothetical protein [Gemmatimonadaceae bacterium]